jgi:anti-sigma B factor antagonist/stage II sporulation protein AA (anti-sigma F factor antagonist)
LEDFLTTSDTEPAAHRLRLSLRGEIDVSSAPSAFGAVIDAEAWPGDVVTLDMSEVCFIDSNGISMLLKVREYLDAMGCQFAVANPSAPLMRVLTMVGLTEHLPIELD